MTQEYIGVICKLNSYTKIQNATGIKVKCNFLMKVTIRGREMAVLSIGSGLLVKMQSHLFLILT